MVNEYRDDRPLTVPEVGKDQHAPVEPRESNTPVSDKQDEVIEEKEDLLDDDRFQATDN